MAFLALSYVEDGATVLTPGANSSVYWWYPIYFTTTEPALVLSVSKSREGQTLGQIMLT